MPRGFSVNDPMPQFFPTGVLVDVCTVLVVGLVGAVIGPKLSRALCNSLNLIFGARSMAMGIPYIVKLETLPAPMLAIIVGTAVGHLIHLEGGISRAARSLQGPVSAPIKTESSGDMTEDEWMDRYIAAIVLFCASGTGVFGALQSGMTDDHSILVPKAILDFFTAIIFAADLGFMTLLIAVPQLAIIIVLFLLVGVIVPLTNDVMIDDFRACGGILIQCTGFRTCRIKSFPIADMLPVMVLIFPFSY